MKILMRADTHVTLSSPETSPNVKCTATQVMAALSVSLCSMTVGFVSAYTSPALAYMQHPNSTLFVTPDEASWIGSLMPLAALVGGLCGGSLIEYLGRKRTILVTAIPFIASWFCIAFATVVELVYAGRAIAGFCVGIASLALPVYLGETVQPEVRGTLGLLPTALGNIGILLCFIAGNYLDWWQLALLGSCLPIPFFILMLVIPETPRWYISKNNPKKALDALTWLRGSDTDIQPELNEIQKTQVEADQNSTNSACMDLFEGQNLKPLAISLGLMFFQQLSGINAVIFYTVMIFKYAGSSINEHLCTIIVGVVNFGSTFIATVLIDRLGRKVLLYISSISMTITLGIFGTFFYLRHAGFQLEAFGWLPLVNFVVYVIGFSLGFGPIPWLMMGEILPSKIRGSAASVTTAFNWGCTFLVTKTFNDLIDMIGAHGAFWLFGVVCMISVFFIFFCVPETQGRSLEDIEKTFTTAKVRRMSSIANMKPMPTAC